MKLNDISFPYPVLRYGSDDIVPELADNCIAISVTKEISDYIFDVSLKINNPDIENLIFLDKAIYTCEVDCIKTVWREAFPSKSPNFSIRIPRKDLAGNITFNAYVSVKEPIHNYHNNGFNSDYGDSSFDMEPGDILVGFPEVKHHIDIKYDKLQAAGSFMIIHEDPEHSVVNFAFDHDKIDINIPTSMFVQYQNGLKTNFAEMMHASLAFNALTCALYELPKIYSDSNGSLLWIQAIIHRLQTEEQFEGMFDAQTMEISDVPAVANLLLKDPYKRLFDYLTEQIATDIDDDNG